jgi:uncharacterized protein (TIGR04255 family)
MNRTLPPLKLSKSPLVLVLCQVRFSPILAIGEYFPRIQDKLRLRGYPNVKSAMTQEIVFTQTGASVVQHPRWVLQDKARERSIIISDGFVVFQTTAYGVFEEFVEHLAVAVNTVAAEVQQLLMQRVGLRYVDLLRSTDSGTWREYVRPEFHGLKSPVLEEGTQTQLIQSVAKTPHGTMAVRLFQNREAQVLPPDLIEEASAAKVTPPPGRGELLTILDLDHFSEASRDYESGAVEREAWHLHDDLDRVFRESVVTSAALEAWT